MSLRSVAHQLLDSPFDGNVYGRENGAWVTISSTGGGAIAEAPTDGQLYGRRGSTASWLPVMAVASGVPASPAANQLWWNSTDGNMYLWFNDGTSTQWVPAVATAAAAGGPYLGLGGGTMTGQIVMPDGSNALSQNVGDARYLNVAGGDTVTGATTFTGPLNWTATGATVSRAAQDRSVEQISVKDYGVTGTADDTAAFTAALNAVAAGGKLFVPAGTYNIGSNLAVAVTGGVTFAGAGSGVTVLNFFNATDGVTFNLSATGTVHVAGITIARTATGGATYANNGLTIACAAVQGYRVGKPTIQDVHLRGSTGRTTGWMTSLNLSNVSSIGVDHITITNPDASGTQTGTGIFWQGLSGSSYSVDSSFNDISVQGGGVGFSVGNWVQGVYLVNSRFIGVDYGIYWPSPTGVPDLWINVANCHFNASTRDFYVTHIGSVTIVNTLFIRFPVTSVTGDWAGIEIDVTYAALIANNIIRGGTTGYIPSVQNGIMLANGNTTTITGNMITTLANPVILNTMIDTTVTGNVASGITGSQLVTDTTGDPSNQRIGNQFNGVPDTATALTAATVTSAGNSFTTTGSFVGTATSQGTILLTGPNATVREMEIYTGAVSGADLRWTIGVSGASETGSNAGTDFRIRNIGDTGTQIGTPLSITRATGAITVGGPLLYTATGGTVARAAQDRAAEVADVRDFGAVGDGSTNDTAAFNAAIATGKPVYVPPGTYIVQPLTISQSMIGAGMGTSILRAAASFPASSALITQNAASSATMRDLRLDGANLAVYGVFLPSTNPQQSGLRFVRLELTNIGSSAATPALVPAGIWCDVNASNLILKQAIVITECYAHDIFGDGIYCNGTGCVISNNTVINTGSAGIGCGTLIDGVVSGNTVYNTGTLAAISADGITGYGYSNLRVLVIGNTVDTTQDHGIHFGGNNIQIVGNKVYNVANYGIILQSSPNTSPTPGSGGVITNNQIDTTIGGGGIRCGWFSRTTVTGNTIANIAPGAPQGVNAAAGISFIHSNDCVASDNIINTTAGYGVYADTALNLLVNGNRCNGTAAQAIFDNGGVSTGMTVFGNVITSEGAATAAAFNGTLSLRNPVAIGGATTINGAASINGASTLAGSVSLLPPVNWSGYATATIGQTSAGNPGLLFLNTDATAPAIGFYRYASTLYFSYGTAATNTGDIMYISPTQISMLQPLVASSSARFQTVGFNNTPAIAKPTVTGAKGGNAALGSLLTALAAYGLITDNSSA